MIAAIRRSISRKLMLVVLATTFAALLVSAIAMLVYDIRTYQSSWVADLKAQADLVGRGSAAALNFDDRKAGTENLDLLKVRPAILAAALYRSDGRLFAFYLGDEAAGGLNRAERLASFPSGPQAGGYRIDGNRIEVFHRIVENQEVIGTVYIRARYELLERLASYATILATVMLVSLVIAAMISTWLQAAFIKPILAVTAVARNVMQHRDFSLRVPKATDDEIGVLVDAFNDMLNEVGHRAADLEHANEVLEHEMMERRAAEQALRIADRRKDEFLATLAHELRNPLAPLLNGLAILRRAEGKPALALQAREVMERQLRQMVRLVDDLLDVSRITTGKLAIKHEHIALQPTVQSAVEATAPLMEQCRHHLQVDMPSAAVFLEGDALRLSQVFANPLNNAAKYTPAGGHIVFAAEITAVEVLVVVRDNGIGIAPAVLPEIFNMFTQADYSLERINAGLGVGLSLVRKLVELHGGSIHAQSDGLGQGSAFTVRLPLADKQSADTAAALHTVTAGAPLHHRILLADDNADFANNMATLLRSLGHAVLVTHDGKQALAAAPAFAPDFAFLDIGLPGLNGYALARGLRALPQTRDCVLIAVTGWGQERDKALAQEAGFDHHLVKPVEPQTIEDMFHRQWRRPGG
ncbi:MAG: ATP-binding protein [Janthinobacterium lividum]